MEKNKNIYHRVENLAKKHGCVPVQLALAWILEQGDDVVPIPGEFSEASLICRARSDFYFPST